MNDRKPWPARIEAFVDPIWMAPGSVWKRHLYGSAGRSLCSRSRLSDYGYIETPKPHIEDSWARELDGSECRFCVAGMRSVWDQL